MLTALRNCGSQSQNRIVSAMLLMLLATAYAPVVNNGFVYDDHTYVKENPAVVSPTVANVCRDTYPPGRKNTALYRPLLTVSFVLDRCIADGELTRWPMIAHLHSVLLHFAVVLLLYCFLRRRYNHFVSGFISAIYSVHPALIESTAWVSARSDVLLGLWGMLGAHLILWRPRQNWLPPVALLAVFLMALLTKESAIVLPIIWLGILWTEEGRSFINTRSGKGVILPCLLVIPLVFIIRAAVFHSVSPQLKAYSAVSCSTRYNVVFMALARYLRLCILPIGGQSVHWPPLPLSIDKLAVTCGVVSWVAMLLLAWLGMKQRSFWGMGIAWYLLSLLPCSNLILPIGTLMAERYLYLPLLGVMLLLAEGGHRLCCYLNCAACNRTMAIIACLVVALFAAKTHSRAATWQTDVTLWRAAAQEQPQDLLAETALIFYLVKDPTPENIDEAQSRWRNLCRSLASLPAAVSQLGKNRLIWISSQLDAHTAAATR